MKEEYIKELLKKSSSDGAKLYSIADALHKSVMIVIWVLAIMGVVASVGLIEAVGLAAGVVALVAVCILCLFLYALDIVLTNSSKVLVHILFSNLVAMDRNN